MQKIGICEHALELMTAKRRQAKSQAQEPVVYIFNIFHTMARRFSPQIVALKNLRTFNHSWWCKAIENDALDTCNY